MPYKNPSDKRKLSYLKRWKKANPEKVSAQKARERLKLGMTPRNFFTPEHRAEKRRARRREYERRKRRERRALRGPKPAPIIFDPLFCRYKSAKDRCTYPSRKDWPRYGGRGIKFLFTNFAAYKAEILSLGPQPTPQHTLDRIDNDGHYVAGNLRWATPKEQRENQGRYA